jgi:hypothetical protein
MFSKIIAEFLVFLKFWRTAHEQRKNPSGTSSNNIVLDKAGPNGIALVAGIKGSLLPHCGITTHEYYLSDRLSEAHSLQLA